MNLASGQEGVSRGGRGLKDEDLHDIIEVLQKSHVLRALDLINNRINLADGKFTAALMFIAKRNDEVTSKDKEIAALNTDLAMKDNLVASLEEEIARLKKNLENSKPIIDTIDLTNDQTEHANKRSRTETTAKTNLAILHQQNQNQRLVQIKQEKNATEIALENLRGEKQAVEANLEGVRGDLEDANELVEQQLLTADIWQGRFDELKGLVEAGQADGAAISAISNRPLSSGR